MHRYKPPRSSVFDYLTHINYYLNERNKELTAMNDVLKANNDFMNQFILSAYDLSGNYNANIKIVIYDQSNNIISQMASDSSGNFINIPVVEVLPTIVDASNVSANQSDLSRCFGPHYGYPYYGYPYWYPYGYPHYGGVLDDDDYYNRGIDMSINHPISVQHSTYHSPVNPPIQPIHPPVHPPIHPPIQPMQGVTDARCLPYHYCGPYYGSYRHHHRHGGHYRNIVELPPAHHYKNP